MNIRELIDRHIQENLAAGNLSQDEVFLVQDVVYEP